MGLLLLDMTQLGEAPLPFDPTEIIMGRKWMVPQYIEAHLSLANLEDLQPMNLC